MGITSQPRRRPHGFTLIELTIVLAVIVTLALILSPSIYNSILDSKTTRARQDCYTLGNAFVQFYKDNGFFPQWAQARSGGPGDPADRLMLLVSEGHIPGGDLMNPAFQGWFTPSNQRPAGALRDQLTANVPAYALRGSSSEFGWNGPYLSSTIGSDPWNNRYMVNVGLIDPSDGPQTASGTIKNAVWVISAGPNGVIETPFSQPVTAAVLGGDDIGRRIQ